MQFFIIFISVYLFLWFCVSDVDFVAVVVFVVVVVASFLARALCGIYYIDHQASVYRSLSDFLLLCRVLSTCSCCKACFSVNCVVWTSLCCFLPVEVQEKRKTQAFSAFGHFFCSPSCQCGSSAASFRHFPHIFLTFSFHFLQCATHCIEMSSSVCV